MRDRSTKFRNGYAVLAIPDSGLFAKGGQIVTGHETEMKFSELIVFSRFDDAQAYARQTQRQWEGTDVNGHQWNFLVIPVLVNERL